MTGEALQGTKSDMRAGIKANGESFAISETVNETAVEMQTETATETKKAGLVKNETYERLREDRRLTRRTERELDALGRALGAEIEIADKVYDADGNEVNAKYVDGRIILSVDGDDPVRVAAVHEAVHSIKETDPEGFKSIAKATVQVLANESGSFAQAFRNTARSYGWLDADGNFTENGKADTLEEIVAQGMGYIANNSDVLNRLAKCFFG